VIIECHVFGEGGDEDVPASVAGRGRLLSQQRKSVGRRFPAILLEELGDETPPLAVVGHSCQMPGEVDQGHRLVRPNRRDLVILVFRAKVHSDSMCTRETLIPPQ
jgi:hypothetical protein